MKKGNILIAVIALLAAASVVKAEEIKVDFDGGRTFGAKLNGLDMVVNRADELDIPEAAAPKISKYEEQAAFWKDSKCIQGDCVSGWYDYYCNLSTCKKKTFSKSAPEESSSGPDLEKIEKEISDLGLMDGLDDIQKDVFFKSLMFRGKVFIGANMKDVESVKGESGVENILRYFLPSMQQKSFINKPYIKDAKCIAPGTCSGGFPEVICPESC